MKTSNRSKQMNQRTVLQVLGGIAAVPIFISAVVQLASGNPLGGGLAMIAGMLAPLVLGSHRRTRSP